MKYGYDIRNKEINIVRTPMEDETCEDYYKWLIENVHTNEEFMSLLNGHFDKHVVEKIAREKQKQQIIKTEEKLAQLKTFKESTWDWFGIIIGLSFLMALFALGVWIISILFSISAFLGFPAMLIATIFMANIILQIRIECMETKLQRMKDKERY